MVNMRQKILIVDDEEDIRELLSIMLSPHYDVLIANSGNEGLQILRSTADIKLVISDIRMPEMDGIKFLEKVKAENLKMPVVIFLTGFADITPEDAYNSGAVALLHKPLTREELFSTINYILSPEYRKKSFNSFRKYERFNVALDVFLSFPSLNKALESKVINLGQGGMFIKTSEVPPIGEIVSFQIKLGKLDNEVNEDSEEAELSGVGRIVWRRDIENLVPRGIGVQFISLSEKSQNLIARFVHEQQCKAFIPKA